MKNHIFYINQLQVSEGTNKLYNHTKNLPTITQRLYDGAYALQNGSEKLSVGTNTLSNGVKTLNSENPATI